MLAGTDPLFVDSDGDGVNDNIDLFPIDSTETMDTDGDGIGNTADTDDDDDGFSDVQEALDGTDPLNKNDCGNCHSAVSGIAYHWNNHSLLESVEVNLAGLINGVPIGFSTTATTDALGRYNYALTYFGTNKLTMSKTITSGESGNVISSADALAALKIAVGINPNADPDGAGPKEALPVSPYQYIAADITGDGRVTSADALAILKMAVKLDSAEPRRWVFVAEDYDFWGEASESFNTTRSDVTWDRHGIIFEYPEKSTRNLIGVLMGDVNGNWSAPAGSSDLEEDYFVTLAQNQNGSVTQWGITEKPGSATLKANIDSIARESFENTSSFSVNITDAALSQRSADCGNYVGVYRSGVRDITRVIDFEGSVEIAKDDDSCAITSNNIPSHDFNDSAARFTSDVKEQERTLSVTRNPVFADETHDLDDHRYHGITLGGVAFDLQSGWCYQQEAGETDLHTNTENECLNATWIRNPLEKPSMSGVDLHNAQVQSDGTYYYLGNPNTLFNDSPSGDGSPVIGFAADGFPIYGSYIYDSETGTYRKVVSGYVLKDGARGEESDTNPGGTHDGLYRADWEWTDAGDLDECNGMTYNGQYGYFVTDQFPYILNCFKGSPHASFAQ